MDTKNVLIHCVFVPTILFSMFGLAPYFPVLNPIRIDMNKSLIEFGQFDPFKDTRVLIVNATHIQWFFASFVYLWCDVICGLITTSLGIFLCLLAQYVNSLN